MWKRQKPISLPQDQDDSVKTAQADPPFWKMVADSWADDLLFQAYIRQERKRALLATLPTPMSCPSLEMAAPTKMMTSNADTAKNPIAYCHCNVLIVPPPATPMLNGEETKVSATETAHDEDRPVEVRIIGGVGAETNHGGRVQAHCHQMYAPGTLQHLARRSLSPTPDSFVRNVGQNYIPFRIPITNRQGVAPAKWINVCMGVNPTVMGCMSKGGVVYQGEVHATPDHDHSPTPDYTHKQLCHLHSDYRLRHEVDEALECISNKSLLAEVARFCRTMDTMQRLQKEIRKKEDKLYCHRNNNCKSVN
jgi:hypothetical protein